MSCTCVWKHRLVLQVKKIDISETNIIWYAVRCYPFKSDSAVVLGFFFFCILISDSRPVAKNTKHTVMIYIYPHITENMWPTKIFKIILLKLYIPEWNLPSNWAAISFSGNASKLSRGVPFINITIRHGINYINMYH